MSLALVGFATDNVGTAPLRVRRRLFMKYVTLFVTVVSLALLVNGGFVIWFTYEEHKDALVRIQREQTPLRDGSSSSLRKSSASSAGLRTSHGRPPTRTSSAVWTRCACSAKSRQ